MKTTKPAVILLALVLLTAAAAQPAEKPAKKEISNTQFASCLVKITTDEAVLPLNEFAIEYLVRSSGVAGKAAREVLDISPDIASELFEIEEIYSIYSDSAGGIGIPPGAAFPGASFRARTSPTTARAATRTPTARTTPRPGTRTTTPTRPTTPTRRSTTPTTRTPPRASTVTSPLPSTAEQTILFRLQVGLPNEAKPAAEEFMVALIENLRSALSGAFDQYSAKLNNQLVLADKEAIRAEQQLVQMQLELRKISDYRDLSRSVILTSINSQRSNIQSTEMRKASDQIEMESIAREIADTEVKIREKVKYDPIAIELQGIVDIQTDSLKRIQKLVKTGTAPSAEVEGVLEKLARARIELAKRREEISRAQGGHRVSQLSSKLASYTQRMAQHELSLSSMERQLKEAMDFLDRADNHELLSLKADITKQSLQEALLWLEQMERKARLVRLPAVTVLGGS